MLISPFAGKLPNDAMLVDIPRLISAYFNEIPDVNLPEERVSFGTSGHRGSSLDKSFNERHILAIAQAICLYRSQKQIIGPLFLGVDTHALSEPALASVLEVLAANKVETMIAANHEYTPTPVVSHAILLHNRGRTTGLADGIVITPSHNPPKDGGIKYNPPHGGPADQDITSWIESKANQFLADHMRGVSRLPYDQACKSSTTHAYDFRTSYINDLCNVIDMDCIRDSKIHIGVDPLGGAGVHYWKHIAEHYGLNLSVTNEKVDPTFRFMAVDWDGQIRMDPSSPYAMQELIALKDRFDIAFACDTDHDRHGIITKSAGLMPTNHFLSVAISYLFQHRPHWRKTSGIGKTIVSSQMIDRIAAKLGRSLYDVPVGFKWFVEGLLEGSLAFVGEESAGATFARMDGNVWTTDKDGIIPGLLAAEITAKTGRDPGVLYEELTREFGVSYFKRIDAPATRQQKALLKKITVDSIHIKTLAGESIKSIQTTAPGNGAPIGGIKVSTQNGWFAARPSGTEDIYKIYAESFIDNSSLEQILNEAQVIVSNALNT
ncbi:MAG: alpha-D-glucose phosphate-specific phosphoglucomutase [Parachlamydiaceae bacterium]|nr:alpha-D-glucose phosphate-specific phosphoglucomutase [Parachlamydiaceae bacterium]